MSVAWRVRALADVACIIRYIAADNPVAARAVGRELLLADLSAAGVVRISLGSAIAQAAYGLAARIATELLTTGTYESAASGVDYVTMNRAFTWTAGVRR